MNNPKVILFACPMYSSKAAIANYLGWKLDLPIFSRDAIRNEVREDKGFYDAKEFENRSEERLNELLKSKKDFILDASIDRKWDEYRETFKDYDIFIVSIDISLDKLERMIEVKKEPVGDRLDKNYQDHVDFLEEHSNDVDVHITDEDFEERLDIVLNAVKNWYGV